MSAASSACCWERLASKIQLEVNSRVWPTAFSQEEANQPAQHSQLLLTQLGWEHLPPHNVTALEKPECCSFLQVWKKQESAELTRGGKETGAEEDGFQHSSGLPWASAAAAVSQEETQNRLLVHMSSG